MPLFGTDKTEKILNNQGTAARSTTAAFSHLTSFDGGEAPLGRTFRKLFSGKRKADPSDTVPKTGVSAEDGGFGRDGELHRSWDFTRR